MKGDAMMISTPNQSYDVADVAEQPRGAGAGTATQQWEDDGGPLQVPPVICPPEVATKPTWSILSLRDLNLAIRLGDWPDNPAQLRRAAAAEAQRGRTAGEARGDHTENA
jgi:hypothetical protein